MKPTLIVLALLIAAGLVAGVVAPPAAAEPEAPSLTGVASEAVPVVQALALPASDASDASDPSVASTSDSTDSTAIPIIDVLGAGILVITVAAAASIMLASRHPASLVRSDR